MPTPSAQLKRITYRPGVAVVLALIIAPAASADSDEALGGSARYRGEQLYFSLEFFGAQLATAALTMGEVAERPDGARIPIYGLAVTEGVAAMVYPLRDEGSTLMHPDTSLPQMTEKLLNERDQNRRYRVTFAHDDFRADVDRLRDGDQTYYERFLPSSTHDAFTWIYAIRDQNLTPGTTRVYYIYDGWKLSRVRATSEAEIDHVLVDEEYIACRRISLIRDVMDSNRPLPMIQAVALPPAMWVRQTQGGEQVGDLWISDDDRRLPVQIVFRNEVISVTARLSSFEAPSRGY